MNPMGLIGLPSRSCAHTRTGGSQHASYAVRTSRSLCRRCPGLLAAYKRTTSTPFNRGGPVIQTTEAGWRRDYSFEDDDEDDLYDFGSLLGGPDDDFYDDAPPVVEDKRPKFVNGKALVMNRDINAASVRLLNQTKDNLGVMPLDRAQRLALTEQVDLILISPDADPPVCRLMEWSKYKYEVEKFEKQKKKGGTATEVKEVRIRPVTDKHDYEVKMKSALKFLTKGARVKISMAFQGREMQFKEQGKELMLKFVEDVSGVARVDGPLNFKTGTYTIMLVPNRD